MSKLSGYLRLMRPINCLMMGFAVAVGVLLASSIFLEAPLLTLIYGFVTGFTLTAASMAINDYYDREIDAINEPNRPIPSGLIKAEEALVFAFIFTVIGFLAAYLTHFLCFIVAIGSWTVSVAYATAGKRTGLLGNFLVSTCVAMPFIYGSLAVANKIEPNVLVVASMAFLSNAGREITKGIVDVQGDKAKSVQTLAVRYGVKTAAAVASFFYLSAVLLSPLPWLLNIVSLSFIPLVAITDIGLTASSYTLIKDCSRENARKVKKIVLLSFIVALLAFLIGAVR